MNTLPEMPSYADVENALKKANIDFQPAQVHGLLCGLICASPDKAKIAWEVLILGAKKKPKSLSIVQQLCETSQMQLRNFSFDFRLLLPDDEKNINVRTEALGVWSQGYLTGLTHAGISIEDRKPGELTEAIQDLIEISKVSFGDIGLTEEEESAYVDVVEYVRLAVVMIYQELRLHKLH